jgi:general secretion pathway protein G
MNWRVDDLVNFGRARPRPLPPPVVARQLTNPAVHQLDAGFTIIEILVVLALISILTTIGMAQYRRGVTHAQEAVLKTDLFDLRDALDQYYADKGQYPPSLETLVTDGYIRKVPVDPFTNAADWQTILSDPDPANPTAPAGIGDVKSASDRTAIDGSKYADW